MFIAEDNSPVTVLWLYFHTKPSHVAFTFQLSVGKLNYSC